MFYEVQSKHLDLEYLNHWAQELDVEPLLQRLRQEAQTLGSDSTLPGAFIKPQARPKASATQGDRVIRSPLCHR